MYAPHEAAVEQTFVNTNAQATLKLGQARGIAMLVPARAGLSVAEYAPNVVKKTVVGAGHGDKAQIRMMIGVLLPKAAPQSDDAADALAIAVCHAHHRGSVAMAAKVAIAMKSGMAALPRGTALRPHLASRGGGKEEAPHDRQAQGHRRQLRRGQHHPRRQRRRLSGALLGAHACRRCRRRARRRRLSIETYVREDQIRLFGFASDAEREWFRLLQTVQGVGAKVALAVLGTLKPAELATAIATRDKAMVARTPGVGPKVAERIVTELKDKVPAFADIDPAVVHLAGALDEKRAPKPVADAVSALVNLGYGQPQAAAAIAAAARHAGDGADTATLIRQGLKELAKA